MYREKLEVGMRIPNYRALCKLLEEPIKDGNSKEAQLKKWGKHFTFERQGNAFIITEIKETPDLSEDKRQRYMKYVEPLLLNYLCQYVDIPDEIEHTYKQWGVEIGLTSGRAYEENIFDEYTALTSGVYGWEPMFPPVAVNRAIYEIQTITRQAFTATADHLKKQGIIKGTEKYYVFINNVPHLAAPEEQKYIADVKQRVMDELQKATMFAIYMSGSLMQYNKRTKEIYTEEKDWDKVYSLFSIEILNPGAIRPYENVNKDELVTGFRKELQDRVSEKTCKEVPGDEDWEDIEPKETKKRKFHMDLMLAANIDFLMQELL